MSNNYFEGLMIRNNSFVNRLMSSSLLREVLPESCKKSYPIIL